MLYHLIKPVIRLALLFFCRSVYFNRRDALRLEGPLLLAVNHPNSFLDAVLIGSYFRKPVHFLARGDAFKKKWALRILASLKCIPVYRLREGKEYLHLNEDTFERCRAIFRKGGIVLIFSEGLCINEWNIRPLRKGTARLAFSSWEDPAIGDALRILPAGVNYNSFHRFGKRVFINFGNPICHKDVDERAAGGHSYQHLNNLIKQQFDVLCFDGVPHQPESDALFSFIINNHPAPEKEAFEKIKAAAAIFKNDAAWSSLPDITGKHFHCALTKSQSRKALLQSALTAIPALALLVFNLPFYWLTRKVILAKTRELGHYDSILATALALFYPIYVLLLSLLAAWITGNAWAGLALFAGLPLSAALLTISWLNWQRFWNYRRLTTEQRNIFVRFLKLN